MSDHRQYREWSAAYVLGALDPSERAAFETHLAACDECRQEVVSLAPLPGLLGKVDVEQPEAPDRIAELATSAIRTEWDRVSQSRRRWRWSAAAAVAVAAIGFLLPTLFGRGQDEAMSLALAPGSVASGTVSIIDKPWGTAVEIEVTNLPESDTYVAWAVSTGGEWQPMATWGPTPTASARVAGASSIGTRDLDRVVITTADRSNTVAVAAKGT